MVEEMVKKIILLTLTMLLILPSIAVSQPQPIGVAGFVLIAGSPVEGATVTVRNQNTGEEDTAVTNSYGLYICSLFANNGDTISATATYSGTSGTSSTTVNLGHLTTWLNITLGGGIVADFSWYPRTPKPEQKVVFQDRSRGEPDTWLWNFGDGTTAVGKNVDHTYHSEGTYSVTLEIAKGTSLDRKTKTITVSTKGEDPFIPPIQPPAYVPGYSMEEMCELLKIDKLSHTKNKVTVVVIDSGITPKTFDDTDLNKVLMYHNPYYKNGLDEYGHGTFINYEVAYVLQRYLPNSIQYSFKAFDKNGQSTNEIFLQTLEAVEKIHPDIVSISAGLLGNTRDAFSKIVERMHNEGIIVVCAAGNYGPIQSSILSPALSKHAIAVGASNPEKTIEDVRDDTICIWSSRGPVLGVTEAKPDLVAPGESIKGAWRQGERVVSGTSLSAPLITAGSAVLLANEKPLINIVNIIYFWNKGVIPDALESSLEESCTKKGDSNTWGAGIPDFEKAQNIFHLKLIFMIAIPFVILAIIVIILLLRKFY